MLSFTGFEPENKTYKYKMFVSKLSVGLECSNILFDLGLIFSVNETRKFEDPNIGLFINKDLY